MIPAPSGEGQISLLTSLTCHIWWDSPSVGALSSTIWVHSSRLSRQYAQPRILASTKAMEVST